MSKAFVYILRSLKNQRFYIGSTMNISQRFTQHQNGAVAAIRNIRPLRLEFFQEYGHIDAARKIEKKLKGFKRKDFIEKIVCDRVINLGQ